MQRKILFPLQLHEKCSLFEAVCWAAFGEYPVEHPFSAALAPHTEVLRRNRDYGFRRTYGGFHRAGDAKPREEYEALLPEAEEAAGRLLRKLMRGIILAEGRFSETPLEYGPSHDAAPWEHRRYAESRATLEPIPAGHWRAEGFRWPEDRAHSPDGEFQDIRVPTAELFAEFREMRTTRIEVEKRGPHLFTIPEAVPRELKGPGRPQEHDWDGFWREAIRHVAVSGLPLKLADFKRHMSGWCSEQWPKEPPEQEIRTRLSPLYREGEG